MKSVATRKGKKRKCELEVEDRRKKRQMHEQNNASIKKKLDFDPNVFFGIAVEYMNKIQDFYLSESVNFNFQRLLSGTLNTSNVPPDTSQNNRMLVPIPFTDHMKWDKLFNQFLDNGDRALQEIEETNKNVFYQIKNKI